jgi:hypothetical protein
MNIACTESHWQRIVAPFTWIWLIGSLITSAYFAFWLFPKVYAERRHAPVQVYFQTKNLSDNSTIYYPNLEVYRKMFYKDLSDKDFLYFSACEILPLSQRPICDKTDNWIGITPSELNCIDVATCSSPNYILSEKKRDSYVTGIVPMGGAKISISDLPPLSLSDPIGWGDAARWPLFFVCLFLALKLGRNLAEFLFLSYSKSLHSK